MIQVSRTMPHLPRKSGPSYEDRVAKAMRYAIYNAIGNTVPLPVLLGKKIIGWVKGNNFPDRSVDWTMDKRWCGFSTYDAIITALTGGSKFRIDWCKTHTGTLVATNWYDLWPVAGQGVAGAMNGTARTAVAFDATSAGGLFHGGNVSTATKHIVSVFATASGGTPCLTLYDRVLAYDQCGVGTSATQQDMTNTATAGRYNGNGDSGMRIFFGIYTASAASQNASISGLKYTDNHAGNTDQEPPYTPTMYILNNISTVPTTTLGARAIAPALAAANTVACSMFLPMAASDAGCRAIDHYTITHTTGSGTWTFALMRPLLSIPIGAAGVTMMMDTVMQVASLERIIDGACLSFVAFNPSGTTGGTYTGGIDVAWA